MNTASTYHKNMFSVLFVFLFSAPTFALTDAEKLVILQRMQKAKNPQNAKERIKNLDKQQQKFAKQLMEVDTEIAYFQTQKTKECTDASKPCPWDDVIKGTQEKRDQIAAKLGNSNEKEGEVCSAKLKRLTNQNERWSKIVSELQPEKDKVNAIDEAIESLRKLKKNTDAKYKDDFQKALDQKQKERNKAQNEFRKKFEKAVGNDLKDIPDFKTAKEHLARVQKQQGEVKGICGDVVDVNGTPTPTVTPTPTPDPGSSSGSR